MPLHCSAALLNVILIAAVYITVLRAEINGVVGANKEAKNEHIAMGEILISE